MQFNMADKTLDGIHLKPETYTAWTTVLISLGGTTGAICDSARRLRHRAHLQPQPQHLRHSRDRALQITEPVLSTGGDLCKACARQALGWR
jgi:hypothetical protein